MPIPRVLVTRFFQLVTGRRFAEAERTLERVKLKVHETEWNRGYFQALKGIMLATKSNDDQYTFLSNMNSDDEKTLRRHRRQFLKHSKDRLQADYDRGFFSAWAEYMRVLLKLEAAKKKAAQDKDGQSGKGHLEQTVKEPTQLHVEEKTLPEKLVQTKLG